MAMTKEEKKEYDKKYRELNKIKISKKKKIYRDLNNEIIREKDRKYWQQNKDEINLKRRQRYLKNDNSKLKEYQKKWRSDNKYYCNLKSIEWRLKNPERLKVISSRHDKKMSSELRDSYVRERLVANGFPKESITPELIEVKRIILKTKRL
jgi:hypothetical protein